jgi:predicted O-methyltransferase YrrM
MTFWLEYERRCGDRSDISDHLPRLYAEANRPDVQILELGVRSGNSTAAFLAAAERNGGQVWSVDTHPPKIPREWHDSNLWTFIQGNDLELADRLPQTVDVLFIDTSHAYRQTLAELHLYASRVHPNGVILLHDTELEKPDDADAGDPPYPVAVAIREWAATLKQPPDIEWISGCYGLAVIKPAAGQETPPAVV